MALNEQKTSPKISTTPLNSFASRQGDSITVYPLGCQSQNIVWNEGPDKNAHDTGVTLAWLDELIGIDGQWVESNQNKLFSFLLKLYNRLRATPPGGESAGIAALHHMHDLADIKDITSSYANSAGEIVEEHIVGISLVGDRSKK